jgi:NAD(P)H-dependent FMN reductase
MALRVLVFYGSVRTTRQGIKAARFVVTRCRQRGHEVTLADAAEYRLPLLDRMYKEFPRGQAPPLLERLAGHVIDADAYVIVSGEYNHNVPPALANMLDHFLEEYFWKPSGIVCYSAGAFGGVRAAIALRSMLGELGMPSVPSVMPIPHVQDAFDDEGHPKDPQWLGRADKFLGELEWYGEALRAARVKDGKDRCPPRSYCEAQQAIAPAGK